MNSLICRLVTKHASVCYKHGHGTFGEFWEKKCISCGKVLAILSTQEYLNQHEAHITGFYYGDGQMISPLYARELVKIGAELDLLLPVTDLSDCELGELVRELFDNPSYAHMQHLRKTWEL